MGYSDRRVFFALCSCLTLPPPCSTRFPYTTLFRSRSAWRRAAASGREAHPSRCPLRHGRNAQPGLEHNPQQEHSPSRRRRQRSEEHTSELQSQSNLVCRLLLEKKKKKKEQK